MKFQNVGEVRYLTFDIFPKEVIHGVFTRHGGISPEPWNSLNVGGTVGDDPDRVRENRYTTFAALGRDRRSIYDVWQIHSSDVVIANSAKTPANSPPKIKADGIVTDNPNISIFMRFADCTPVILYDYKKKVIGLVHAGWKGTVSRTAGEAVKMMRAAFNSKTEDILAAIGPSIGPDHYEVGGDVLEQVRYSFGKASDRLFYGFNGKLHLDLWAANKLILEQVGVGQIEIAELCTACHPEDWFSHRQQKGKTGRFGVLLGLA